MTAGWRSRTNSLPMSRATTMTIAMPDRGWTTSCGCGSCARSPPRPAGACGIDQLADMFTPLYMWRAAAFMSHTALESPAVVQARLDSLCDTFKRLKPALVANWSDEV